MKSIARTTALIACGLTAAEAFATPANRASSSSTTTSSSATALNLNFLQGLGGDPDTPTLTQQDLQGVDRNGFEAQFDQVFGVDEEDGAALETPNEEVYPPDATNPNLPEVKGDFNWDAKYGGADDWITEGVPGKIVMDEISLARQVTALNNLETQLKRKRQQQEIDSYGNVGWVESAELLNSRFAMFFLFVGLFTESFTGVSIPGQVEEMLRIMGFIGFD